MTNVKLYTTEWCTWCQRVKEFFKQHKLNYTEYNVGADEKARDDMIKKSKQTGVPVIDIDGKIVIGYDEARLRELLKIKG